MEELSARVRFFCWPDARAVFGYFVSFWRPLGGLCMGAFVGAGEWATLLSMTEQERLQQAHDHRTAQGGLSTSSALPCPQDEAEARAAGSSLGARPSDGHFASTTTRASEHVVSRSVQQLRRGLAATTQGQDCCIKASIVVGPYAYYFGMIDILQV